MESSLFYDMHYARMHDVRTNIATVKRRKEQLLLGLRLELELGVKER